LLTLACGDTSIRSDGAQEKGAPPASQTQDVKAAEKEGKGHVVSVKGPCGHRPCCKPIMVTLPSKLEPKVFSPRMAIKLRVDPDGSVQKVEITKSSGVEDVDRQLREGASRWCMEKTKEGREVDFMVNLDVR
jgi:TonB family protein